MPREKSLSFNCSIGLRGTASLANIGSQQNPYFPVVGFNATTQHMVKPNAQFDNLSQKVIEIIIEESKILVHDVLRNN